MNKVLHVPAYFAPIGKEKTVKVPTGEKTTGFFGGEKDVMRKEKQWVQTGYSDCKIDSERLSKDLHSAIESLNNNGYEVVSVTSVISGDYSWKYDTSSGGTNGNGYGGYGYGYGFSFTDSLLVIAKKVA